MRFHFIAALCLILFGCAQGAGQTNAINQNESGASPKAVQATQQTLTLDPNSWYVVLPPQRAYAADRSPQMGGPLPTSGEYEHRGAYDVASLTEPDTTAPLSKWKPIAGAFTSEKDCEVRKATMPDTALAPQRVAQQNARRPSLAGVDTRAVKEMLQTARCVTGAQLASH